MSAAGRVFHLDTSSAFAELIARSPSGPALATIGNVIALPGGAAIKVGPEIFAAIGVGGSPGGEKDESCAQAGVAKIVDRLPK